MKNLFILFALFLTIGMASAQQSLTKEETISYIHDIMKTSSGKTNFTLLAIVKYVTNPFLKMKSATRE